MRCDNCNRHIEKKFLVATNMGLNKDGLDRLNAFLPEQLKKESFCEYCVKPNNYHEKNSLYKSYDVYFEQLESQLTTKENKYIEISKELNSEKEEILVNSDIENIVLFSNTPNGYELLGLVESYRVVDSGMWSTSSDQLDAMWSAVHDNIARQGNNTNSNLSEGLINVKTTLKKIACTKGGNVVVDVKFNFSELAGNGKILMFCQGTVGIDKNRSLVDFEEVEKKYRGLIENLLLEISAIKEELKTKSTSDYEELVNDLVFDVEG